MGAADQVQAEKATVLAALNAVLALAPTSWMPLMTGPLGKQHIRCDQRPHDKSAATSTPFPVHGRAARAAWCRFIVKGAVLNELNCSRRSCQRLCPNSPERLMGEIA